MESLPASPSSPMAPSPQPSTFSVLSPPSIHLSDVYLHQATASRFSLVNEGDVELKVDLSARVEKGELEFWKDLLEDDAPPPVQKSKTRSGQPSPKAVSLSSISLPPRSTVSVPFSFTPYPGQQQQQSDAQPSPDPDQAILATPRLVPGRAEGEDEDESAVATPVVLASTIGEDASAKIPTWWLDDERDASKEGATPIEQHAGDSPAASNDEARGRNPRSRVASGWGAGPATFTALGDIYLSVQPAPRRTKTTVPSAESSPPQLPTTSTSPRLGPTPISTALQEAPAASQLVTIPFSAAVCESVFTLTPARHLDSPSSSPTSSLASLPDDDSISAPSVPCYPSVDPSHGPSPHSHPSLPVFLDFGSDIRPHSTSSRTFTIDNPSSIPLVASIQVIFDSSPWTSWASLEVISSSPGSPIILGGPSASHTRTAGAGGSPVVLQLPVLPPRSQRDLRLVVSLGATADFSLDVLFRNVNHADNTVLVRATGTGPGLRPDADDADPGTLLVLGGEVLDFGDVVRGGTVRRLLRLKNVGGESIEVVLGSEAAVEATFKFGGVKGDEVDDEMGSGGGAMLGGSLGAGTGGRSTNEGAESRFGGDRSSDSRFSSGDNFLARATSGVVRSSAVEPAANGQSKSHSSGSRPSSPTTSAVPPSENGSHLHSSDSSSSPFAFAPGPPSARSGSASRSSSYRKADAHSAFPSESSSVASSSSRQPPSSPRRDVTLPPTLHTAPSEGDLLIRRPWTLQPGLTSASANLIEELTMRPGVEYRLWVSYTPSSQILTASDPGSLVPNTFRLTLDYHPLSSSSSSGSSSFLRSQRSRRTVIACMARECSTRIKVFPTLLDFGKVTVGSSKKAQIEIENQSDLPAKVELRFISKVINASRIFATIPPRQTTVETLDFFPRRINPVYTKQLNVRNLLDRSNDQLVEIHAENIDVEGVTLHSHLYKILTPSGSNYLDFGPVVLHCPAVRTVTIENCQPLPLSLSLTPAHPEDLTIYVKADDAPTSTTPSPSRPSSPSSSSPTPQTASVVDPAPVVTKVKTKAPAPAPPPTASKKERFLESMASAAARGERTIRFPGIRVKGGGGPRDKSVARSKAGGAAGADEDAAAPAAPKPINMVNALKKGSKGRSILVFGNQVMFKDRTLLAESEYLDLACVPVAHHRVAPASSILHTIATLENERPGCISLRQPHIIKEAFPESKSSKAKAAAASLASAAPTLGAASSTLTSTATATSTPTKRPSPTPRSSNTGTSPTKPAWVNDDLPSPALTGKRKARTAPIDPADVSRLSLDELLSAIEHQDNLTKLTASPASERTFVRTWLNLKAGLAAAMTEGGRLQPLDQGALQLAPGASVQLVFVMQASGATRPHVQGDRSRRQDSRVFIRLLDFGRELAQLYPGLGGELEDLPVRELLVRSSMTRSVLEVAQTHANFGNMDKGDSKSKTIVIHNRSEVQGVYRLRLSGKIQSNDFQLGDDKMGVIEPFGQREASFTFSPSMAGLFNEVVVVENVVDPSNALQVVIKASVRKTWAYWVTPLDLPPVDLALGSCDSADQLAQLAAAYSSSFTISNTSKAERTFIIEVDEVAAGLDEGSAIPLALGVELGREEVKAGLTKEEDEELENILQKLKIARRKNKPDKIEKYENRLIELGVPIPTAGDGSSEADTVSSTPAASPPRPLSAALPPVASIAPRCSRLTLSLVPNQLQSIQVSLHPLQGDPSLLFTSRGSARQPAPPSKMTVRVWEKKDSDNCRIVTVPFILPPPAVPPTTPAAV